MLRKRQKRRKDGVYLEEGGWTSSCAQQDASTLRSRLRYLQTPLPACARRRVTTTTLQSHPHSEKEAGLRLQPIRTREHPVSNLWGGRGRAGGGHGWSGMGRVRARRARVESQEAGSRRGAGSAPWQLPTPTAQRLSRLGSAAQDALQPRREDPSEVSEFLTFGGQSPITTMVPSAGEAGTKVSGPHPSGVRQGRENRGCRAGGRQPGNKGAAGGFGSRMRSRERFRGRPEAGCAVQGAKEAGDARRARSSEPTRAARSGREANSCLGRPTPLGS